MSEVKWSYPVAVIMQRTLLANRWVNEKWEASGVVQDIDAVGSAAGAVATSAKWSVPRVGNSVSTKATVLARSG